VNWSDVGRLIVPLAPTIGRIMGGLIPFPGGSLIGEGIGGVIARQFGVPATPEAVAQAVKSNPNEVVLAKLAAATEEAKAQWPAIAAIEAAQSLERSTIVSAVNETMRQELGSDSLFKSGWRPMIGWLLCYLLFINGSVMVGALVFLMVTGNSDAWDKFAIALPVVTLFLSLPAAVCGVTSFGRSWEKSAAFKAGAGSEVLTIAPGK